MCDKAIEKINSEYAPIACGMIYIVRGVAYSLLAERTGSVSEIDDAIISFNEAAHLLPFGVSTAPDWAKAQSNLGHAQRIYGEKTNDKRYLSRSIVIFEKILERCGQEAMTDPITAATDSFPMPLTRHTNHRLPSN